KTSGKIKDRKSVPSKMNDFIAEFDVSDAGLKFNHNGLFGYMNYDAVKYFEDISIVSGENEQKKTPDIVYYVYKYIIAIDHFKDELYIVENRVEGDAEKDGSLN